MTTSNSSSSQPIDPSTLKKPNVEKTAQQKKRKKILTLLGLIFLIIAVVYFFYWLIWGRFKEYTEDAYVSGNIVQLMPQVSGTIIAINTDDTQLVMVGQALIKLDETDASLALQRAQANLAETVRRVRQYYENVRQDQAIVIQRQADLLKAQLDFKRRINLVSENAISREELQHVKTTRENAEAQANIALYKLAASIALVENASLYQHPLVEQAKTNFMIAYVNWVRTTLRSPATGYVAKRNAQVGQQTTPGSSLMAIIPLNEIWVDANFKESELSRIRIGQNAELTADLYGKGVVYHGKVVGLSAGTGSAFQLLPPQNATGNWIKIVQRVPVRIHLDPDEITKNPLRIGLSMRVTIYTRGLKGNILTQVSDTKTLFSTPVFDNQLRDINEKIETIIRDNAPNNISITGLAPLKSPEHD